MSRPGWALLLVLAAQTAGAAELRELLAVLEIAVEDEAVPEGAAALLTDQLRSASAEVAGARLKIMTRENMTELLPPGTDQRCFKGACLATIGVVLQARYVMGGTVRRVGSRLTLTVEAYDSNSKNLLGSRVLLSKNVDELVDVIVKDAPGYVRAWIPGLGTATVATAPPAAEPIVSAPAPPPAAAAGPTIRRSSATNAASDLTITARPSEAVRLDITEPSGRTFASGVPYKNPQATPGRWKVTARAAGYRDETREVDVPADDTVLAKMELTLLGALSVTGTPAGAQVTVTGPGLPGGRDQGGLPWEASGLASGSYRVKVARTGYRDFDEAVQVESGRTTEVVVALQKVEVVPEPSRTISEDVAARGGETPARHTDAASRHWALRGGLSPMLGVLGVGVEYRSGLFGVALGTGTHVLGGGLTFGAASWTSVGGWYIDAHCVLVKSLFLALSDVGVGFGATAGWDWRFVPWLSVKTGIGVAATRSVGNSSPLVLDLAVGPVW